MCFKPSPHPPKKKTTQIGSTFLKYEYYELCFDLSRLYTEANRVNVVLVLL